MKTLQALHPLARYNPQHCRCSWDEKPVFPKQSGRSKTGHKINKLEVEFDVVAAEEIDDLHSQHITSQKLPARGRKQRQLQNQHKEVDDLVVTLSSPTSTVPSFEEGIVGLDVSISSSFEETTRSDADTVTIANDISGTWDLLKQPASAPKNAFEMAYFPST